MAKRGALISLLVGAFAFGAWAWQSCGASGPALPLRTVAEIRLPGSTGRLDYESLDAKRHRLSIAHLGDGTVLVVDTATNTVIGTIPGMPSVRGVLAVPELDRVYAAAQGNSDVAVIDGATLRVIARVPVGDVDGLAYDPVTQRVFVSDEGGEADAVIDARKNRLLKKIPLDGQAGNTQYDSFSHHIFVAVQTKNDLAEIDPDSMSVIRRYALPGCLHGHGVAIASQQRMIYVACQENSALVGLNLRTGQVENAQGVGLGPDVLAIDTDLHRLYVASEVGVISVFDIGSHRFKRIAQERLAPNAHVVGVDSVTHRVYFPLNDINGKPVLRVMLPSDIDGRSQ